VARGLRVRRAETAGPQSLKLKIVSRGRIRRVLKQRGRVKATVVVRYDSAVGSTASQSRKLRLRLRR
jgi:hypothetical protein